MTRTITHRDRRFEVTVKQSCWGGRQKATATVYMQNWGFFYQATRSTPKAAYRAADTAIRKYSAKRRHKSYTAMRRAGLVG